VLAGASRWEPSTTIKDGEPATLALDLPPGRWELSLQYDATRPVTVSGPGYEQTLPGNLDYRGTAPFWALGEIRVRKGGPVRLTASVESPPAIGRLLGTESVAHLGAIAATAARGGYVRGRRPLPGEGERLAGLAVSCGRYGDWSTLPPLSR
jgi:hypothetical protein